MPTNEYGQPTDSKGNVKTQSQVIEAELEPILQKMNLCIKQGEGVDYDYYGKSYAVDEPFSLAEMMKELAALVLKHRHDVYFQAYRDGLQQGRKEAQAMLDSSEEE